jgi:hypothetical protein
MHRMFLDVLYHVPMKRRPKEFLLFAKWEGVRGYQSLLFVSLVISD